MHPLCRGNCHLCELTCQPHEHHNILTRMEKRGLVLRKPLDTDRGVEVFITSAGKSALDEALPIVSKAIRKHFLDQITDQDIESITKLAERTKTRSSSS